VSRFRRHPLLSAIGLVLLAGIAVFAISGIVVWRAAHHDDASDTPSVDTIAVLGAAQYDGTPSPVFQGRLDHALRLWEQDRAGVIIVLGANQPGDRTTEAAAGRDYLIDAGVPADSVVAIPRGQNSQESLQALAATMRRLHLHSSFLVSDPWHNARIKRMASDLGIEAYTSATWTSAARSQEARVPGYARETLAYLYYRLTGR
jgi:uncharacterized SAM-binding protein YcdF (DUF218 family)